MNQATRRPQWPLVKHWRIKPNLSPRGFQLSNYLSTLTADIARRVPELAHLDARQMLFSVTRARKRSQHGLQARVTPLRFHGGTLTRRIRRTTYQVQRYVVNGQEMLYLVTFCVPRFLDQPFEEKLITIFHELYHISPRFDGDLRRHDGRYEYHTHSQSEYDEVMSRLVRHYLLQHQNQELLQPLHLNSAGFREQFSGVYGYQIPQPKMIPVQALQPL